MAVPNLSPYIARSLINLPTVQEVEREKWAVAEEGDRVREERGREYRSRTTDSDVQQGVVHAELWRDFLLGVARDQEQIQSEYERALDRQVRERSGCQGCLPQHRWSMRRVKLRTRV